MDPLSLTTSIIALAETGTTLGKLIWDTCDSFRSARADMQDMAEEVDLITSLFAGLGSSMKRAPDLYSEEFRRMAKNLISKCHKLFFEISDMFPADVDEMGQVERQYEKLVWSTFTKDRILKKQTELRQMQHMFSFMETMQRYIERPEQSIQSNAAVNDGESNAAVGGIPQQIPIQLSGSVPGQGPIQVTLTLQTTPVAERHVESVQPPPYDTNEAKQRDKTRLQNLRMSPYFSKSILDEPQIETRAAQPMPVATNYSDVIPIEPEEGQQEGSEGQPEPQPEVSVEQPHAPPTREQAAADVDDLIAWWSKLPQQARPSTSAQPPPSVQPVKYTMVEDPAVQDDSSQRPETPRPSDVPLASLPQAQNQPQADAGYGIPERGLRTTETRASDPDSVLPQAQNQAAPETPSVADSSPEPHRKRTYSITCNGCREGIEGVRHKCRECSDFHYCEVQRVTLGFSVAKAGTAAEEHERNTWPDLERLAREVPGAGVHFQDAITYARDKDAGSATGNWTREKNVKDPWFKYVVPDFRTVHPRDLPRGIDGASRYTSVCINTAIYLPWLLSQCLSNGVVVRRGIVNHVADAVGFHHSCANADVVVNCTGISAGKLGGVEDSEVVPARGQTVIVRNDPKIMADISGTDDGSDEVTYIMQRAAGGGTVLGGCYQKGNWDTEPDPNLAVRIMKRCVELCPALTDGKGIEALSIIRHGVGLRPIRNGGTRIEKEKIRDVWVVHQYGHGGYGYQASYGSAKAALKLVEDALSTRTTRAKL
ncbi:MAG: hypothetical protein M1831_001674 [Alyxoria varia]|nr:MAG: hypothetical protein M1831_001674 [Alyxoria varia]